MKEILELVKEYPIILVFIVIIMFVVIKIFYPVKTRNLGKEGNCTILYKDRMFKVEYTYTDFRGNFKVRVYEFLEIKNNEFDNKHLKTYYSLTGCDEDDAKYWVDLYISTYN